MMIQHNCNIYDVLVVGGGMVGAALGCCLGQSDIHVAVVEDRPPLVFNPRQEFDLRVSAINIASRTIMETVGAWPGVVSKRLCSFRRIHVWESGTKTEFCSDDIDRRELGFIVENRIIQLAFLERINMFANVDVFMPGKTVKIQYDSDGSSVRLEDGRVLTCRLLVAADGGHSRVRQAAGIGVSGWDYGQHAMVLSVETGYDEQDITWQRFTPTGPQAFLPLPGNHASLVWYTSADEVSRLIALSEIDLIEALTAAFPKRLGNINRILGRASFPLKRQHAHGYVKPGVALIGDAAHIINPLAGQGVNIGLLDAAALAQILVHAANQRQDLGSFSVLKRYERLRRWDNLAMMNVLELFYRVFSNNNVPLKLIRNLGLGLAERLQPAKNKVMRYATGLDGNLPKLARGEIIVR